MRSLGFGEGMELFLAHAIPYHNSDKDDPMTIEQKALELVNAAVVQKGMRPYSLSPMRSDSVFGCLCRALEAHELDKSRHAAEMREQAERFSEAVKTFRRFAPLASSGYVARYLEPFILAPVDPLVEALDEIDSASLRSDECATALRAALDARGLAIVKKEAVNG